MAVIANHNYRRNQKAFAALIATPAGSVVVIPAGARLAVSKAAGASAGTLAVTLVASRTRVIKTPLLAANELSVIDWVERKTTATLATGFALWVDVGLNKFKKIAQG